MTIDLSNLEGLSESAVSARLLRLTELVDGLGVGASVRRGFIRDFVLRLNAIVGQAYSDRMETVGRSLNPLVASAGPIDSDVLTQVASTYGLSRRTEGFATGQFRIELSRDRSVLIPAGTLFQTVDGRQFVTQQAFAGRALATEIQSATDRQLVLNSNGNYEFLVDATAVLPGIGGNVIAGTEAAFVDTSVLDVVRITTATDFSGGSAIETDEQLLARIRLRLPVNAFSTRLSVAATLATDITLSTDLIAVSTIGYGDAEMVRSQRRGLDGRGADVYMRTGAMPITQQFNLKARLASVLSSGRLQWSVDIGRDVAPGFYLVVYVHGAAVGEMTNLHITRGLDMSPIGGELTPDVSNSIDAAFSRYQTATVTGESGTGDYEIGDEIDVEVSLSYMPDVATAQQLANSRRHRFLGGDTLVRAAIPSYVSVGIDVHAKDTSRLPAAITVQESVARVFNSAGFAGRLHTSRIASIVHGLLPPNADVASVDVIVETLLPNGTIHRSRTRDHIDTPNIPELAVTARTCVFLCDPAAVTIRPYVETLPDVF